MKRYLLLITGMIVIVAISGCGIGEHADARYLTSEDLYKNNSEGSYVIGSDLAKVLQTSDSLFNYEAFVQGFTDQYKKRPLLLKEDEMDAVRKKYKKRSSGLTENPYPKLSPEGSLIASERFMMENRKKEGVKETESGLQYIVLKEGNGIKPSKDGKVLVHYIGTLRRGEVFENTYEKGAPVEMPLESVVQGMSEGILMMSEGGRYKFFIPPNLAYGSKSVGPIMPNSVVIFEVELIKVIK